VGTDEPLMSKFKDEKIWNWIKVGFYIYGY
jgi:hypothetical protein